MKRRILKKIYILIFPVFYLMLMMYYQYIRYDILVFISQYNYLLTITWIFIGLGIMTSVWNGLLLMDKNDRKMDVICLIVWFILIVAGFICLFILPKVYPPKIYYMLIDGMPFLFFLIGNMMSLLGYNLSYILMKK
ncbi:hypothetical protein [Massilimicrobiota sp. An80]|uniref:hypothetical protein n=1 Tax=Massilimicrobiota sp. An80 TaxID=1965658 RepID=UPI000B4527BC|nr:hypothetical protein [Massilimicrobiota sp. An80]OUN34808.1 hypothetical protein B5G32_08915 [Massilimicrobiota sp. An80]